MNKRHMLFIPLLAVGALFSCNGNKNKEFTLDSVTVNLKDSLKTVRLGDKVSKDVIESVDAHYVKKNDDGEVVEEKDEKNVTGYTVKTDFTKPLDYSNMNDGFDVTVEYQGTKGSESIDIISYFQHIVDKKVVLEHEIKANYTASVATLKNNDFEIKASETYTFKAFDVIGDNVITLSGDTYKITNSVGSKGTIFVYKGTGEDKLLIDGYTIKVVA